MLDLWPPRSWEENWNSCLNSLFQQIVSNMTCNFYVAVYGFEQLTGSKSNFASGPHSFKQNNHLWLYIDSQIINLRIVIMKICVSHTSANRLWMSIVWSIPWPSQKNEISSSIWHKSSIQTVEILFPWRTTCLSKFL